jgi:hypothetical protein
MTVSIDIAGLSLLIVGGYATLWYKLGKLEGKVEQICRTLNGKKEV